MRNAKPLIQRIGLSGVRISFGELVEGAVFNPDMNVRRYSISGPLADRARGPCRGICLVTGAFSHGNPPTQVGPAVPGQGRYKDNARYPIEGRSSP